MELFRLRHEGLSRMRMFRFRGGAIDFSRFIKEHLKDVGVTM